LREQATARAGLPDWLFEESYQAVGDLAETISLLLPIHADGSDEGLATWVEQYLLPLRGLPPEQVQQRLQPLWAQLDRPSLMLCLKLITGSFRVGVSKLLVTRALAQLAGLDAKRVAQRMVGYTDISHRPTAASYQMLVAAESADEHSQRGGQPYPFFLAHPLQAPTEQFDTLLGPPSAWQIEWKWDGIRAQVVKREGQLWVWSRGEELVTDRFPELHSLAQTLPDGVVLDGEILVWKPGDTPAELAVQPFALLQQRIGRKTLGKKIAERCPGGTASLRPTGMARRGLAQPAAARTPPAAGTPGARPPTGPGAAFAAARGPGLGRPRPPARAITQPGCRGADAQAT